MIAVDTNVFVYRLDRRDPTKQAKARELLRRLSADREPTGLLWQVMGELMRQLSSWQDQGQITRAVLLRYVAAFRKAYPLVLPGPKVIDHALEFSGSYSLSHWDSMLLGACRDAGVTTLYTEDMGAPIAYGKIELINPFA